MQTTSPAPFRFAHMTDSHLYGAEKQEPAPEVDAFYRACIDEVAAHGVDFIVHTGDMCTANAGVERNTRFRDLAREQAGKHGLDIHFVRGNHDSTLADADYVKVYGPGSYWFAHKGWAFLALDRYWKAYEHWPFYLDLSTETLGELDRILAEIPPEMPLVLLLHENPVGVSRFAKGERLLALLARHNLRLNLFGHVQCNYLSRYDGVTFATVVGEAVPFDTSPLSFNIVSCEPSGEFACAFHPYLVNTRLKEATPAKLPKSSRKAEPAEDWLNHRGPSGTRFADVRLGTAAPELIWEKTLPGELSVGSLNVAGGVCYAGTKTRGRFEECTVNAVDVASGETVWSRECDGSVEGGVALEDGFGYCGTTSGTLMRLRLSDGEVDWSWNNGENLPIAAEPLLDGDRVHAGANWEMSCVAKGSGEILWRRLASRSGTSYFGPGHSIPLVVGDRVVHSRIFNGNPVAKSVPTSSTANDQNHALLQTVLRENGDDLLISPPELDCFPGYKMGSPILHQGRLYMPGMGLFAFDEGDLVQPAWFQRLSQASATPAAHGDRLYLCNQAGLFAFDLEKQEPLWKQEHGTALLHYRGYREKRHLPIAEHDHRSAYCAPLLAGNQVIYGTADGILRGLAADSGEELWSYDLGEPILSAPTLTGNCLLAGTWSGRLLCFALDRL